jgi:hypothetical protein
LATPCMIWQISGSLSVVLDGVNVIWDGFTPLCNCKAGIFHFVRMRFSETTWNVLVAGVGGMCPAQLLPCHVIPLWVYMVVSC